jgi:hypothetical protein
MKVSAVTQLDITSENVPGGLAQMAGALAAAGVSIEAICHTDSALAASTLFHLIADDTAKAKDVLTQLGKTCVEQEVIAITCKNETGVIAKVSNVLGEQHVNIEEIYTGILNASGEAMFVVGVSGADMPKAITALKALEK